MATLFSVGDIFERGADLTVLPCSAKGHLSRTAEARLEMFGLARPGDIPLGSIQVHPFPGAGKEARLYAWAASVMNFTSRPEVIRRIGQNLGRYANDHQEIQVIESPLLGAGAGGLDPMLIGSALKSGFDETCRTDAVLFVYGQIATVMAQLRQQASADMPLNAPTRHLDTPIEIFFSYAHEDRVLMDAVRRQLIVHERNGRILKWHDRQIPPGHEWRSSIDERLRQARIILLFMSPDFIESRYCYEVEGDIALERHRAGEATVVPVILRPCPWEATPFGELQPLPRGATPISRLPDLDEASLDVATEVIALVDDLIVSSSS